MNKNNFDKTTGYPTGSTPIVIQNGPFHISHYLEPKDAVIDTQNNDTSFGQISNTATKGNTNTTDAAVARGLPSIPMPFQTANGNLISHETVKNPFKTPFKINPHTVTPQSNRTERTDLVTNKDDVTIKDDDITNTEMDNLEIPAPVKKKIILDGVNYHNDTSDSSSIESSNTNEKIFKIYHSALLDKKFKPNEKDINLPADLDPLKPLILSQHEVFSKSIQDLGDICLSLTKLIEKKKESLAQLKNDNKIPRSLRLKIELQTSPSYTNDNEFIELKDELSNEVTNFIKKGTKIMTTWAEKYTQRLIRDRCLSIFIKALKILDGLTSFNTDIMGTPSWPSVLPKYTTLFLLKLYLSNTVLNITELVHFFELTADEILLHCAKLILNTNSDEEATTLLSSLSLSDIDMGDELQNIVIKEILLNFDQIIRLTTSGLWSYHKTKMKQYTASNNLKLKMLENETISASEATALALTKATEQAKLLNETNLNTNLRLINLEKGLRRQEHKTNEIQNQNKKSKSRKNFSGSQQPEQLTSPDHHAPKKQKSKVVDLTKESPMDGNSYLQLSSPPTRNQRISQKTRPPKGNLKKSIKWKASEIRSFHPDTPTTHSFLQNPYHTSQNQNNQSFHGTRTSYSSPTHGIGTIYTPSIHPHTFSGSTTQSPFVNGPYLNGSHFNNNQGHLYTPQQYPGNQLQRNQNQLLNPFPQIQNSSHLHTPFGTPFPRQK